MQSFITQAPEAMALVRLAYPECGSNNVTICPCDAESQHNCASYWSGGYRDYFTFVDLASMTCAQAPQQSMFDRQVEGLDKVKLPRGTIIVVQHFMGVRKSVSIYIRHDDMNPKFLPLPKPELSAAEKKVLFYTRSLKNSYGGKSDIRRRESKMSPEEWVKTQAGLMTMGLLDKRGALTINGRNAANGLHESDFGR